MRKKDAPDRKRMRTLCFLCCLAYFVSYLTRLNYAACMVELQAALKVSKQLAGLPVTACFLSYGIGQVVFGILGDRFLPRKMILTGLLGSALCNLLVVFVPHMPFLIAFWCLNGVFQSMLWPPLIRIMAEHMDEYWYRKSCVRVSLSASAATILLYLLIPVCIQVSGWKSVFYLAAAAGIAAALVWARGTRHFTRQPVPDTQAASAEHTFSSHRPSRNAGSGTAFGLSAVLVLLSIVLHGMLKDGITTWMPVYMADMFHMSSSRSILSAALLPVCSIFSTLLSSALLYRLKNEILTAALLFGAGALAGIAMIPAYDRHPGICILMMTLITGCMYGINLMLISRVPGHFAAYGNISTVSGTLNAATYVGSALSTYGFGAVAEQAGWSAVVMVWVAAALAGTLLLTAEIGKWARFCCRKTT